SWLSTQGSPITVVTSALPPSNEPRDAVVQVSGTVKRTSRLGIVARPAGPVARQRPQGPEHGKQKKLSAPGNAGAPGQESAQSRDHGRGRYTGSPHKRPGTGTDVLHRELFCLHAKEWKMFKE